MRLSDLHFSPTVIRFIQMYWAILVLGGCYTFSVLIRQWQKKAYILASIVLILISYSVEQVLLRIDHDVSELNPLEVVLHEMMLDTPLWSGCFLTILLTLAHVMLIYRASVWSREHITLASVKEAMDNLPDGLCYYDDNGIVLSVNLAMNEISNALTGSYVTDGRALFELIMSEKAGDDNEFLPSESGPMLKLKTGDVYIFTHKEIKASGRTIYELKAVDLTEEYNAGELLKRQNERLKEQQERLRAFGDNVTGYTIEKELLQTKIRIHDDFGKALLAAKHYLKEGGGDRDRLLDIWRTNVVLLEKEKSGDNPDIYASVMQAAKDVGVKVNIDGELPTEGSAAEIVLTALRECITNTFRHAKGDELYVKVDAADEFEQIVEMTNNGQPPVGSIRTTGGLGNLIKVAGRMGAGVDIESRPVFKLTLRIPRI